MKKILGFVFLAFLCAFFLTTAAYANDRHVQGKFADGTDMPVKVRLVQGETGMISWKISFEGSAEHITVLRQENIDLDRRTGYFQNGSTVFVGIPRNEKIDKSAFSGYGHTRSGKTFSFRLYFDNRTGEAFLYGP